MCMCVFVCMYVCIHIYNIYIYIYVYTYLGLCLYVACLLEKNEIIRLNVIFPPFIN